MDNSLLDDSSASQFSDFKDEIAEGLETSIPRSNELMNVHKFPLILGKQCLYIMDWKRSQLTYTSGVEAMFGYAIDEFDMNLALNFIHPEDAKIVNRIIRGIIKHSVKTDVSGNDQYLILTFRVQKKDGSYIRVMRQSSPYQIDMDGKLISTLSFITDISFISNSNKVEWEIYSNDLDIQIFKKKYIQRVY